MIMIEKINNFIIWVMIGKGENKLSNIQPALPIVTKEDIEKYLEQVRKLISKGKFRIDRNRKRPKNIALFDNYVITEEDAKNILLGLKAEDFSHLLKNEHPGYEHEILYVFGKEVDLLKRYDEENEILNLYIKFNKIDAPFDFLIVISFHIEDNNLSYPFKP